MSDKGPRLGLQGLAQRPSKGRRSASLSTLWTSAPPAPTSRRRLHGGSLAARFMWTAGSI